MKILFNKVPVVYKVPFAHSLSQLHFDGKICIDIMQIDSLKAINNSK